MKKKGAIVFTAVLMAAMLAACGGSYDKSTAAATEEAYEYDTAAYDSASGYNMADAGMLVENQAAEEPVKEEGAQEASGVQTNRKLIKTVNMSVETERFDELMPNLENQVAALGGYIESMSVNNREYYHTDGTSSLRYGDMTVRIPKDNLETFLSQVSGQSNVVSRSEYVEDVTLQYVDLESHKKALTTEQDRLLELLEQAETVEDIITIEGRLSDVRYQIESMESQLRTYDNKIDYSTVYLSISEVERYTPTEENSVGERIKTGFLKSLDGVGNGLINFAVWFLTHIPYLVVWAIVIGIIFLIVKCIIAFTDKRRKKRQEKYQVQPGGQNAYPNQYRNPYQNPNQNNPYAPGNQQRVAEEVKKEDKIQADTGKQE